MKKIIWDFVKNLNIRPSHGALNYEAALQASQHRDKIGNQYSLNIHQKLSRGKGRRQLVGGAGALASSHVVVALVRLPSDSSDTCGLTWLLFFFFRHPNFSPNIDNIYIIFGLSRKKNGFPWRIWPRLLLEKRSKKKIQNKERLSEHDETSIKFLKEAIKFHF